MTTTAGTRSRPVAWKLWVPGVATPVACFIVDFAAGELVLRPAPAALLALAGIGLTALALSRSHRTGAAGLACVGPMWVVGGVTLALGLLLAALSGFGLLMAFVALWESRELVLGSAILAWALLGFTPLWTGITYLLEAYRLTKDQAMAHAGGTIGLIALVGGVAASAIVLGAHAIDSGFVATRVAAMDRDTPEVWQEALQSLGAYPLCGRARCRDLVCRRLVQQFPLACAPDAYPNVPAALGHAYKQAFGVPLRGTCRPAYYRARGDGIPVDCRGGEVIPVDWH